MAADRGCRLADWSTPPAVHESVDTLKEYITSDCIECGCIKEYWGRHAEDVPLQAVERLDAPSYNTVH